jgi:hypothetical protein
MVGGMEHGGRQASDGIEVTPEMTAAGIRALCEGGRDFELDEDFVARLYRAIERSKRFEAEAARGDG